MSIPRVWRVLACAVVVATFAGVVPALAQTGGLTGAAKGEDGAPLVGYPILIERQDIRGTYKTKTNKKGEYIYIGLPIGNYKVTIQDPTGQVLDFVQTRVGLGDPTAVDFDMVKVKTQREADQKKALETNPELQRKVHEQAKDQKQFTGLKAIFDQGQALYTEKKYAEAAQMFEQAVPLAKGQNFPVILGRTADSFHKSRQFEKAIEYYQKAIAAKPEDAGFHNNLGSVYADQSKFTEAALEFEKAAQMDPTGAPRFHYNLGVILYNAGKMDEAAEAFRKATAADPNFADAYFMQGSALMGKVDMTPDGKVIAPPGTEEALQTYLKLEPNGKFANNAQGMLQTVQGKIDTTFKATKKKKS